MVTLYKYDSQGDLPLEKERYSITSNIVRYSEVVTTGYRAGSVMFCLVLHIKKQELREFEIFPGMPADGNHSRRKMVFSIPFSRGMILSTSVH